VESPLTDPLQLANGRALASRCRPLQALQINISRSAKVNPPEMMGSMGHGAEDIDPEELQGTGDVGFHFCFVYFLFGSHTDNRNALQMQIPVLR
jgi:hypothetical protein